MDSTARRVMGRPPLTSRAEIEDVAFALFAANGYDETSVEDIARAAGIGRRTFFRYYSSKTDLVWGDFDAELAEMRRNLAAMPVECPVMEAIRRAVVDFNDIDPAAQAHHRQRMSLILNVPTLLANSTLRFVQWRAVLAEYAAARLGPQVDGLVSAVLGYSALGATLAAYEQWLRTEDRPLTDLVNEALSELSIGFDHTRGARPTPPSWTA